MWCCAAAPHAPFQCQPARRRRQSCLPRACATWRCSPAPPRGSQSGRGGVGCGVDRCNGHSRRGGRGVKAAHAPATWLAPATASGSRCEEALRAQQACISGQVRVAGARSAAPRGGGSSAAKRALTRSCGIASVRLHCGGQQAASVDGSAPVRCPEKGQQPRRRARQRKHASRTPGSPGCFASRHAPVRRALRRAGERAKAATGSRHCRRLGRARDARRQAPKRAPRGATDSRHGWRRCAGSGCAFWARPFAVRRWPRPNAHAAPANVHAVRASCAWRRCTSRRAPWRTSRCTRRAPLCLVRPALSLRPGRSRSPPPR